ncbi:phospholipase B1, membrane-associated-like [Mugil cephalus]|uniref:phospholipase B1, membrane-associated-like n=1 Tax=Mugil cephalus TaxID=48193 RepID=UPI001FB671A9|nr:phospholipase B1, membrane-associated-like [Mugil cephalus]
MSADLQPPRGAERTERKLPNRATRTTKMFRQLLLISLLGLTRMTAHGLPCAQMARSQHPPSTVNSVKPSDVALLSYIRLHAHSVELFTVASRLSELMTQFSPELTSHITHQTNVHRDRHLPRRSTVLEQAKEVTNYLQNNPDVDVNKDWKLVLLFVQADQLCGCEQQQVASDIRAVVKEVDEALQLLHSQMKRTIVSVALWDGEPDPHQNKMCACMEASTEGEFRLMRAMMTQALQDSLDKLMVQKHWYSNREDFTVSLHAAPLLRDPMSVARGKPLSESEASQHTEKLVMQMWANLLQSTAGKHNTKIATLPCPTEDQPFLRTEGNSPSHRQAHDASPRLHPLTGTEMTCEDLSPSDSTPTSVHELRPGDIKVVASIGDSLTAGNGIASSPYNVLDVLTQYRGLSWNIGGDQNLTTVTTLPNILKHFNHNVKGFSLGTGGPDNPKAFFNQAVAGAKAIDMLPQAQTLVAMMKSDPTVNFDLDWKVITLFIGGNDMCDYCSNSLLYSVENYALNIQKSLDYLQQEVPRALVNLVEPFHILPLREMNLDSSLNCPSWLVEMLCPCVVLPEPGSEALQALDEINRGYQRALVGLVESGRYDTQPDFTVVLQPFFRETVLPRLADGRPDRSFFSADCFHLSQKAQTQMARSLWNNMLEPLGQKTTTQDFNANNKMMCPTKTSPYIRTYSNSNYSYSGPAPTPAPNKNWGSDFSCVDLAPSDTVPTSVHKLRPADIKVVAALGDSATTGTGAKAKNLVDLNVHYKGVSWSIGGDNTLETVTTLPNILRKFNPSLTGFSKGRGLQKSFNMAVPEAKTSEIPAQVQALIKAMRENKEVNFNLDWKLVTIFTGENDLCHYCTYQNNLSPQNFSHSLMQSLDMLYKEVPRVLVNVVEIFEVHQLKKVSKNTLGCKLLQRSLCPCVIHPSVNSPELEKIRQINLKYQTEIQYLLSGDRYNGKEDFAVVLQPFLQHFFIPYIGKGETDPSFFSLDCFHISERTHAEMAIALWNNMLEPVGRKQVYNNFTYDRSKIHCPSEASPFIFTKINSLPSPPVTDTTTAPSPATDATFSTSPALTTLCPSSIPVWVPVVVGIVSLLAGVTASWLILSSCHRRKNKAVTTGEVLKGTGF